MFSLFKNKQKNIISETGKGRGGPKPKRGWRGGRGVEGVVVVVVGGVGGWLGGGVAAKGKLCSFGGREGLVVVAFKKLAISLKRQLLEVKREKLPKGPRKKRVCGAVVSRSLQ